MMGHRESAAASRARERSGAPSAVVAIAALAALCGVAPPLAAQGPGVFEIIASRKQAPTEPLLGGISLAHYRGPIGIRFSGALNLTNAQDSLQPVAYQSGYCRRECRGPGGGRERAYYSDSFGMFPSVGAWTADADLIFAPVRAVAPLRALLLGFSPYAFAGIGGYGTRPTNSADTTHATWSVGGGAHHELLGWLGVGAEARYRRAFGSDSAFTPSWRDNLEYRVGLTVSFGGHHATPVATPAPVAGGPCGRVPCEADTTSAPPADSRFASRVLDVADGLVDTPFSSGGTTPRGGFDAAGFVRYVFGQQGVSLPASVREMSSVGSEVPPRVGALRPGDLVFFANDGANANHVAIYAGRNRIIHSTASGNGVRYDTLGDDARGRWFADHLVGARRITLAGTGADSRALPNGADQAPPPQGGAR